MKHWIYCAVAATALVAACGGKKDDAATGEAAAPATVGDVRLPGLSLRSGNASEASAALAAFSMQETGSGRVSFASKDVSGANATFRDIAIEVEDGETPIRASSLEFVGLEMTDAGAAFSQMTLSGITLAPEDEEGEVAISEVRLTNPSPALAAWVAGLFGEGEPGDLPSGEALSFDGLSLAGLAFSGTDAEELERFEIGRIDLRGMGPEKLAAMVIEDIAFEARDEGEDMDLAFSVKSVQVAGAGTKVIQALQESGGDEEAMLASIMSLTASNPGDPGYDTVLIDALDMNVGGVAFSLPSMESGVTRNAAGQAVRGVTKPFEMTVTADPEGTLGGQLAGPLGLMGYEQLAFRAAQDVAIDPEADAVTSRSAGNYLELVDGFRLSGGGKISGLAEYNRQIAELALSDEAGTDPAAALEPFSSLSLYDMEIMIEDKSIVERAFTAIAAMNGDTPENMKAQAQMSLGCLPMLAAPSGIDPAILTELSGALSSFLAKPGTLTIKLDPEAPITGASFTEPSQVTKASLGFSAKAE